MYLKSILCFLNILIVVHFSGCQNVDGGYTFINAIRFPYSEYFTPFMGLIVAFDIKLVPSQISVDMVWSVEANYLLPMNDTTYSYPPIIPADSSSRGNIFDRTVLYKLVETKLKSFTKIYKGRNCLLRIICEMTLHSTKDTDVLGDLLHVLLRPSSSKNTNLPLRYSQAEVYGHKNKHCKKYIKKCSINLLDYMSVFGNLLDYAFED